MDESGFYATVIISLLYQNIITNNFFSFNDLRVFRRLKSKIKIEIARFEILSLLHSLACKVKPFKYNGKQNI